MYVSKTTITQTIIISLIIIIFIIAGVYYALVPSPRSSLLPRVMWNTTWGGMNQDSSLGVAVGRDIYVVGETWSFGVGFKDAFLAKYDSKGNLLWNVTWGRATLDEGLGVALTGGGVYVVGSTYSSEGSGADVTLVKYARAQEGWDAFLARYDTNGNEIWNTTWGGIKT